MRFPGLRIAMSAVARVTHIVAIWRVVRAILFTAFAVVSIAGLARAWTTEGTAADRRVELDRLQGQIQEQEARRELLEARLQAFSNRGDVRLQTIRTELGMVRDNERIYVFK